MSDECFTLSEVVSVFAYGPRLADQRLTAVLGIQPHEIRALIDDHAQEFEVYGRLERRDDPRMYVLNEPQTLLACLLADTAQARAFRREVVWRYAGDRPAHPREVERAEEAWPSGRRPKFWPDLDVRRFLIEQHRQTTVAGCLSLCRARFGAARTPSKSALARFWLVLDSARQPRRATGGRR